MTTGTWAAAALRQQQARADEASVDASPEAIASRARAIRSLSEGGALAAAAEQIEFERAARVAESRQRIDEFNAARNADAEDK